MKKKTTSKKKKEPLNIEITNVQLSSRSKKSIKAWEKREIKAKRRLRSLDMDTAFDIEYGRWSGPVRSYDFADIKEDWEKAYHEFFDIPDDVIVEIDYFDTGILSFEKGVYPKYHKRRI